MSFRPTAQKTQSPLLLGQRWRRIILGLLYSLILPPHRYCGLVLMSGVLLGSGLAKVTLASPIRVVQQPDLSTQKLTSTKQQTVKDGYKLLLEGKSLVDQDTPDALQQAIQILERAQQLFKAAEEPRWEGTSLNLLGNAYILLQKPQEAIAPLIEAVSVVFFSKGWRKSSLLLTTCLL